MGDLAASGGYYVAMPAKRVLAEPTTITGSIGVFAVKPDVSSLLQKLGVNAVTLKRGEHADAESAFRGWTSEERKIIEAQVHAFYDTFLARVAEGRHLGRAEVEAIASGRVWTGSQALQRKLVDALGTLEDALAVAASRAGLQPADVAVKALEPPRPFLDLAGGLGADADPPLARAAAAIPALRTLALLGELGPVLALPSAWLDGAYDGAPRP
jgi:protease-4